MVGIPFESLCCITRMAPRRMKGTSAAAIENAKVAFATSPLFKNTIP